MNHGCHLILTENGSKILAPWKLNAPTKGATRRRRRWPCPSPPPPSTRWQCLSSFSSGSLFNSSSSSHCQPVSCFMFAVCTTFSSSSQISTELHHRAPYLACPSSTSPSASPSSPPSSSSSLNSPAWSWRHHVERCQLQSKSKWGRLVRSTS